MKLGYFSIAARRSVRRRARFFRQRIRPNCVQRNYTHAALSKCCDTRYRSGGFGTWHRRSSRRLLNLLRGRLVKENYRRCINEVTESAQSFLSMATGTKASEQSTVQFIVNVRRKRTNICPRTFAPGHLPLPRGHLPLQKKTARIFVISASSISHLIYADDT